MSLVCSSKLIHRSNHNFLNSDHCCSRSRQFRSFHRSSHSLFISLFIRSSFLCWRIYLWHSCRRLLFGSRIIRVFNCLSMCHLLPLVKGLHDEAYCHSKIFTNSLASENEYLPNHQFCSGKNLCNQPLVDYL